ncbi:MAG: N-formylglutamate amidohydrolase [Desulfobulbaceae bacterium]|nr:N-formylglutamate amidohydrolase [Desulfobulbaceae bacterium]
MNNPYGGTIVPEEFANNKDVWSIMIEVNRRLYLTDDFRKNANFDTVREVISEIEVIFSSYE